MRIGEVLRWSARHFPHKEALIFEGKAIPYGALNDRVNRLADGLLRAGAQHGDRLAVLLHNCPEYVEVYFACAKIGCIFVPVNNLLKRAELHAIFDYVCPRFLLLGREFEEVLAPMVKQLSYIENIFSREGSTLPDAVPYESLIAQGSSQEPEIEVADTDVLSIFFTSGTTGRPKGVMRTHRHDFLNAMANAIELKIQHEDRALFLFPFYHIPFVDNTVRHALLANTMVIRREGGFDTRKVLQILAEEKITMCQFVPTMIAAMVQDDSIESFDLSHFRLLVYVGSTIPVAVLKKAMKRFPCRFVQLYGQTESGPATTALRAEDHVVEGSEAQMARLASAGRPVLGYEVKVVDESGNEAAPGQVGEIAVRGDAMTMGYWDLPEETADTIREGWLHTGDMGRLDVDGYMYIVDRKHDMIISGGKNIYPREIEELLYRHEAIREAAVIGVPDDYWVESVKALVVLKEGKAATEEEIISFCKEHLASYKKPRSVEFRKELPKNPTGKILKRVLRDAYWREGGPKD